MPEEKIILFVGRLVYEKGVHLLIEALPKIMERVNVKLIVVGDGYMKEQLSSAVRSMGLMDKVFFTGFVDDETLRKLQKYADVSVVPSLFEPFGIVALEAMAAGSPVVVADTGGLSEMIEHDVTGVKFQPGNTDQLATCIIRVLTDENYADRLRINAYERLKEEFSWEIISLKTKAVYERVLKEAAGSIWVHVK